MATETVPARPNPGRSRRILTALAIIVIAFVCLLLWAQEPGAGSLSGVITDSKTGKPIPHAHVWLTKANDSGNSDDTDTSTSTDALGSTQAPYGWAQGSGDDTAGEESKRGPKSDLEARADNTGHYTIDSVPEGDYSVSISARGYDTSDVESTHVDGDDADMFNAQLNASAPTLTFDDTTGCWLPGEDAVMGLNGDVPDPHVTLTLYKADVDDLIANSPSVLMTSRDYYGDSGSAQNPKLTQVRKWSVELKHSDESGNFYQRVHLGGLNEGYYYVTASGSGTTANGWVDVTRLALVRKLYHNHILAYVADLQTGRPQANIPITLTELDKSASKPLGSAVTDANGLAELDNAVASAADESKGLLLARRGNSTAAVALELNSPGETGENAVPQDDGEDGANTTADYSAGALRSFIYTERPIYRPGQTVYFKGIARFFTGIPNGPALTVPPTTATASYNRPGSRPTGPVPPGLGADGTEAPRSNTGSESAATADLTVPINQTVTVDIKDAQETLVSHQVLSTNDMGSWNGSIALSDEALTGEYTIHAHIGNQESDGTFVVAAYHKPEFKVTLAFDKPRYVRGDTIKATVTAAYYFGAPVARGSLHYFVNSSEDEDQSIAQPYNPNLMDGTKQSPSGTYVVDGNIKLDDNGQAVITLATKVDKTQSEDVDYNFDADVTDASQRDVSVNQSVTVGQGEFTLDVQATPYSVNPGTPVSIKITANNVDNKGLANQPVEVVTAYEAWSKGEERLSAIQTQSLTTDANGEATMSATPPRGGLFLVRAKSTDRRGNEIVTENTVWVTTEDNEDLQIQYPEMAVLLDKPQYKIGDTAHALINTDHPGTTALVAIEGGTLYQAWTVPLAKRSTSVDIPVSQEYAPGVTISVCAISSKQYLSSTEHLAIDNTLRKLNIAVSTDRPNYHAGDPASISVTTTDTDGQPVAAEVSVGVVDSSIYAIQEDSDTKIDEAMVPDQGDVVDTDYSCPALYLGDVDKGDIDVKLRTKFKDTAYWNPTVRTGVDGKATVPITLPDNLTTWRVTCIGATSGSKFGKSTCNFTVGKDLVARLETPNFLIAGDRSTLTGVVNNNTTQPFTTNVRLDAAGLTINGPSTQTVTVPAGGNAGVTWPVVAGSAADVDLQMRAWVGDAKSPTMSDGVDQPITVSPHASHTDIWQAGSLVHFADRTVTLDKDTQPASSVLRVHLSPSVSSAMIPAWKYLSEYPYGGVDDTASALIGDAILAQNYGVVMAGSVSPNSGGTGPVPSLATAGTGQAKETVTPEVSARLKDEITRGELRLARLQRDDGSWAWFETGKPDFWMTTYATCALLQARDAGFAPNKTVLDGALKELAQVSENWMTSPRQDLYGPSGLALAAWALQRGGNFKEAGKIVDYIDDRRIHPLPGMDDYHQSTGDLAVLVIVAHDLGGPYAAKSTLWMNELWADRQRLGELTAWPWKPHQQSDGAAQEPPEIFATAWAMLAAETVNPTDPRIDGVARWLMANRTEDHWYCVDWTAVTLMALGKYIAATHERTPDFNATVTVNGAVVKTLHFGPDSVNEPDVVFDIPATSLGTAGTPAKVHLQKAGQGRLYWSLDLREAKSVGTPPADLSVWQRWYDRFRHPERLEPPFDPSGYRIKRVYLRNTSRRNFLWEDTVPDPSKDYRPNDDVIVRLIIDATRAGSHVIVEEPIPAGCTISEVSGDEVENWDNWWDYTDVRDDKIVFFISDLMRGRHEIDYHLQATAPGTYDVMPTSITGTFDPTLHVLGRPDRVTVE